MRDFDKKSCTRLECIWTGATAGKGVKPFQVVSDRTGIPNPYQGICGPLWHLPNQEDNHGETEVGIQLIRISLIRKSRETYRSSSKAMLPLVRGP